LCAGVAAGHSWGGHLAFHLASARPERVLGVIGVDALGAVPDGGWGALDTKLFARLERASPADAQRARQLDQRAMAGAATVEDAMESLRLVWPYSFANPEAAPPMPELTMSVALLAGVVGSVRQHFEQHTLERALPSLDRPFALIHGESDPLPAEASRLTASLARRATFELIRDAGHFPWLEQPEQFQAAVARALRSLG
jgi:pimeloyl-ACP methyl ester carboxylesterase